MAAVPNCRRFFRDSSDGRSWHTSDAAWSVRLRQDDGLRLIAGLEQASDGQILIDGDDVTLLSAAERDVSMVFQSYALFPHMTVLENVCYGLLAAGMRKAKAVELAQAKLALVGLAGYGARLPSELSGGQQQRVAVARAIVLEPKVLLFDEPLSTWMQRSAGMCVRRSTNCNRAWHSQPSM